MNDLHVLMKDIAAPPPATALDLQSHVARVMTRLRCASRCADQLEHPARGSRSEATFSRDIGVQLYAKEPDLRPLSSGARVPRTAAFTGLRNLAKTPAHLLLFAVDAKREVHWIAPEYTDASTNPAAIVIAASREERLLPSAVVFDDLAAGTLRIVALIAGHTMHIADVERIAKDELNDTGLMKHFPRAELRQISVQVTAESKP